jgi:hypothetical protein
MTGDLKAELTKLHNQGAALAPLLRTRKGADCFQADYQRWYSAALSLVKFLGPDRLTEFRSYYEVNPARKWLDHDTWTIQDYLVGNEPTSHSHCQFDMGRETRRCLSHQLTILASLQDRVYWMPAEVEEQMLVELLESHLKSARGLLGMSARAAGAVASFVLETYLKHVICRRRISFKFRKPHIRDLADALKGAGTIDLQAWRQIRWLADLRDRSFAKDREPTPLEARDLLDGAGWLIKNVF